MVFFNCEACGTGLKKNQVEPHMIRCKTRLVSCIDCNKNFRNDEFKAHTKCLTECERYESKSSFQAKPNKGEVKQNAWIEKVGQAVQSFKGSAKAKSLLEKLVDYPNVPRKKAKFFNFVRNSFRSYQIADSQLEEIWSVIESFDAKQAASTTPASSNDQALKRKQNSEPDSTTESQNSKKFHSDNTTNGQQAEPAPEQEFDWIEAIKKICSKQENQEISLCKLQKKIYKKYKKFHEITDESVESEDYAKFLKKLNKKLKKASASLITLIESSTTTAAAASQANGSSTGSDQLITIVKLNTTPVNHAQKT